MEIATPEFPQCFCWTRFGDEAGQSMAEILARKELERRANGGVFLWGIGNAVGPGMRKLLQIVPEPLVVFSPIKGRPRRSDSSPSLVAAWTAAETMRGCPYQLPPGSMVTSRLDPAHSKPSHYALVCYSDKPLAPAASGPRIGFTSLRNITTGNRLGASQVTAVVRVAGDTEVQDGGYQVAWTARLAEPHFIRLRAPVHIDLNAMLGAVLLSSGPVKLADCAVSGGPRPV